MIDGSRTNIRQATAADVPQLMRLLHQVDMVHHRLRPDLFKPEYLDEMTVDAKTELKHKAACVWQLLGSSYTPDELEKYCAMYGITSEQALDFRPVKVSQQK